MTLSSRPAGAHLRRSQARRLHDLDFGTVAVGRPDDHGFELTLGGRRVRDDHVRLEGRRRCRGDRDRDNRRPDLAAAAALDRLGVFTNLGASPSIAVNAANGSGTLTVAPLNAGNGSAGEQITFTYTAAAGGMVNGP